MALLQSAPTTTLGRAVREQHAADNEDRRRNPWSRRIFKGFAVLMIALWGALGLGSGTAQAGWPWEDVTTAVYYLCGPMDVPAPVDHTGFDTSLGLNDGDSDLRATVVPSMEDGMGDEGNGLERLNKQFSDEEKRIIQPTYERYGFSALTWTNYGNGCASKGFWLSGVTNFALDVFVKFPMILGMGLLEWTMDPENVLFKAFAAVVQPVATVLGAIFQPWIFFIAPIGVFLIWIKTRSTTQVIKAFIWVVCVYGFFAWLTGVQAYGGGWQQSDNPGVADPADLVYQGEAPTGAAGGLAKLSAFASNFVTEFTSSAACKISETGGGGEACDPDDPMGNIHQSLWEGIPYQVWLSGEVGESTARETRKIDAGAGEYDVSWGAALLNGNYAAHDKEGAQVAKAVAWWNQASYADSTDADAKVGYWSGGNDALPEWSQGTAWEDVPFLANVKFICNDKSTDDEGSSDEDQNRWMYGGSCDAAGADTANMVPYFKGEGYSQQIVYAFAGAWAVIAVVLTIGIACIYLMAQKMLFYWLLTFAPIFLAISTFADEKRRQFAKKWFELLVANVLKQCVAVVIVLFVSYSMSTLLATETIPWIVKPYAAIMLMIAMIMFAKPMAGIAKAAVAGDTSAVDRMANAPQRAAAATAKAAVVAGAIAATGGAAAAAAPGVLGGTSLGGAAGSLLTDPKALRSMSKVAGSRGAVGKGLKALASGVSLKDRLNSAGIAQQAARGAETTTMQALLHGPEGNRYRDANGNITPAGAKAARADAQAIGKDGARQAQVKAAEERAVGDWFRSYEASKGERHPLDPREKNKYKAAEPQSGDGTKPAGEEREARPHGAAPDRERLQQRMFADDAASRFDQSGPAVDAAVHTTVERTGRQVLEDFGVPQAQLASAPEDVLLGRAYGSGATSRMDPGHAATASLTTLRFAVQGTDEELERVRGDAMQAIAAAGLPNEVSSVRATAEAGAEFHPAEFVGVMAPIDADTSWQDRAALAVTMQQAIASVPLGHPAGDAADAYVAAVASPATELETLELRRAEAIEAFDRHSQWNAESPLGFASDYTPPDAEPAADSGHDAAGLDLAHDITHSYVGLTKDDVKDAVRDGLRDDGGRPTDGATPGPAGASESPANEESPRDAPRGEECPEAEYNAPQQKRSGIYDYDDEEGKDSGEGGDRDGDDGDNR